MYLDREEQNMKSGRVVTARCLSVCPHLFSGVSVVEQCSGVGVGQVVREVRRVRAKYAPQPQREGEQWGHCWVQLQTMTMAMWDESLRRATEAQCDQLHAKARGPTRR